MQWIFTIVASHSRGCGNDERVSNIVNSDRRLDDSAHLHGIIRAMDGMRSMNDKFEYHDDPEKSLPFEKIEANKLEAIRLLADADSFVLLTLGPGDKKSSRSLIRDPQSSTPVLIEGFKYTMQRLNQ